MDLRHVGKSVLALLFLFISITPIVSAAKNTNNLPDLSVTRVWLNQRCQINIELRNVGKGRLSAGDYKRIGIYVGCFLWDEKNYKLF